MASAVPPVRALRALPATLALYGGFFLTGCATVLLGPLIPELSARWGLPHGEVAGLFVAQFAASSVGAVLSSRALRRSLVLAYALLAVGALGLAHFAWPFALLPMSLVGLSLGLAIPATNLLVALANPERRGASLSTLNFVWGLGAVCCPLLFAALSGRLPAAAALWLLAVLAALVFLSLAVTLEDSQPAAPPPPTPGAAGRAGPALLLLLAGQLFLYVGVESAIGGWLAALSDQVGGQRAVASLLVASCFWGALLAGRAGAPLLLRHVTEPALHRAALATAAAGTLSLLLAGSRAGLALGALVAGLGLAPIFPLTVSLLAAQTASTRSRGTGWVFAFGGLGGAALPWLTGRMTAESLRPGFLVPAAGLALIGVLLAVHRSVSLRSCAGIPAPSTDAI